MDINSFFTFDRILGVAGFLLTAGGFWLTIWQLLKTKALATAAKEAADNAVAVVRGMEAVTKMHDISARSRLLLQHLKDGGIEPASVSAFELRETVAKYRKDSHERLSIDPADWRKAVDDVTNVHERLVTMTDLNRFTIEERKALILTVSRLHTLFTSLAAQA